LAKADALWQQAEQAVADEPEVLDRVKRSRMSVDYAIMERARLQAKKQMPANEALLKLAAARLEPFCAGLQHSKLTALREGDHVDKAAYRRDLAKDLGITLDVTVKPFEADQGGKGGSLPVLRYSAKPLVIVLRGS
jgi:hypothetical protein